MNDVRIIKIIIIITYFPFTRRCINYAYITITVDCVLILKTWNLIDWPRPVDAFSISNRFYPLLLVMLTFWTIVELNIVNILYAQMECLRWVFNCCEIKTHPRASSHAYVLSVYTGWFINHTHPFFLATNSTEFRFFFSQKYQTYFWSYVLNTIFSCKLKGVMWWKKHSFFNLKHSLRYFVKVIFSRVFSRSYRNRNSDELYFNYLIQV